MTYHCAICHEAVSPADANLAHGLFFIHSTCQAPPSPYRSWPVAVHIQQQEPPPRFIPVPYMRPMGMRV
jgi:hypothetical protein